MKTSASVVVGVSVLLTSSAFAKPPDPWAGFADARRGECLGPAGKLAAPIEFEAARHRYRLEGSRLVQVDRDRDSVLRIGVISATKDDRDATLAAIGELVKWMRDQKMDLLIANGDLAANEFEMETVFRTLADSGVLVLALTGNTESCGSFNKLALALFEKRRSFVNGNWVRRLELDDATLITLPGYYDRRFVHTGGAAGYKKHDLEALEEMAEGAPQPLIFVSHGPPKMKGKAGIDIATDAGHVGDPAMAELLEDLEIKFGIFGHILEAGGRGSDLIGRRARPPNKWHDSLFVNAGTANPDPWELLDGTVAYGMAMFVEIKKNKARYRVQRLERKW